MQEITKDDLDLLKDVIDLTYERNSMLANELVQLKTKLEKLKIHLDMTKDLPTHGCSRNWNYNREDMGR